MKTLIKYLVPAVLALVAAAACQDHRSDYMEEFQTMVYFRNGGEQDLALYRTGEDGLYKIPVCKSGRNLKGEIEAILIPFDEAQLAIYNITYETEYKLIPPSCYKFLNEDGTPLANQESIDLDFGPDDPYKVVNLSVNTNAVSALQEADEDAEYVMAFQLFSGGKVSADINYILLKPDIEVPMIGLLNPGEEPHKFTSASQTSDVYTNTLSLNMDENRWDFSCTMEVMDQAWLDEYNMANAKEYVLLPASLYTIPEKVIKFTKGTTEATFKVNFTREGMEMLTEYALPIVFTSCSKPEFKIDEKKNVYVLTFRLDPDLIPLEEDMVSVSSQAPNDGGGAPALIDDNVLTYWHSVYSTHNGDPTYGEYVDIDLTKSSTTIDPLKSIVFSYCTRSQNDNGTPHCVGVWVKAKKDDPWTQLGEDIETLEMTSATTNTWVTLPVLRSETAFSFIRFAVLKANPRESGDLRLEGTKNFTSLSELQLFGSK